MKRLVIAAALLLALLGGTVFHSRHLFAMTDGYCAQLKQSAALAAVDDWSRALDLTEQTLVAWEGHDFYLHTLLQHADIDEIRLTFHEVVEYLKLAEPDQYTAANAKLITQLELLAEAERLNWKNVL